MAKLDYKNSNDDFPKMLHYELDRIISGKSDSLEIENIPSGTFCEMTGCEANDFNGWQCDWWGSFRYKNRIFDVAGCAWYSNIAISLS